MIGFTLQQVQKNFFDRQAVLDRMTAKMVRVFKRFGGTVRKRDRQSIRYANSKRTVSQPGQPPLGHRLVRRLKTSKKTGISKMETVSLLKENILFMADERNGQPGVVIGPVLLSGRKPGVLRIIEEGGEETVEDAKGRTIRRMYKARPHTKPAFEAEMKQALPTYLGTE